MNGVEWNLTDGAPTSRRLPAALLRLKNFAHVISDTFKPDPSWPTEILHGSDNNRGRWGTRAGVRNRLRQQAPLPSILLANVQSLENKLDDLRARVTFQRDVRDCNILCFTETWLTPTVPDRVVTPSDSFLVFHMDRMAESNKTKGGGVCFMVTRKWCDARSVSTVSSGYSPHLEHLSIKCRPFYLPREFTSVITTVVYIPPDADTGIFLTELHDVLSAFQNKDPNTALIAIERWSAQSEAMLQDALEDVDWDMFRASANDVNEFTDVASPDFLSNGKIFVTTTEGPPLHSFDWIMEKTTMTSGAFPLRYASGGDHPYSENQDIPESEAVGGQIDPRCNIQLGSRNRRYERLQSGVIRHPARRERHQTPVSGASGVSLPSGGHMEHVTGFAHHYGLQNQGHRNDQCRLELFARFEVSQMASANYSLTTEDAEKDVRAALKRVNTRKVAGPDGITGRLLRCCADQLAGVLTYIFNESLAKSGVPKCFKRSIIVPITKNNKPSCLNDYRPVALTSEVMKVFERLMKNIITSFIPNTADPLQFEYRPNRSTEDAISHVLHTTLSHVDMKQGNYVRLLFADYSSAFNTIVPGRLYTKLRDLGLNSCVCAWVLDFLTGRSQVVRVGRCVSDSITTNIGAPQGCVLSPLLYSLYTSDCVATHSSNTIVKFADDTVVLGFITNNDESAYMDEMKNLASW
ncbi:hypothetical protein H4Q32_008007 [Labeo rohita]|uniref:Reverse transcriptase domain-containing protein n=1 Tax=Labeo rohita TaxID=84645 RepID=A0ABQ8MC42_LABRO|nr:hypothetical protein H4Q32_008007 [Labeo rohita]